MPQEGNGSSDDGGGFFFFFLALNCPEALGVTMQWLGLDSGTQLLL